MNHNNNTNAIQYFGNGTNIQSYLKKMKEIEINKYNQLPTNMKPTYHTNSELNCGISRCNGKDYLMDHSDKDAILNFHKKFYIHSITDLYPSYGENSKRISYLEFIYKYNREENCYVFKNGNPLDIRRTNVMVYPKYAETLLDRYNILEYLGGHCKNVGIDSGVIKNPIWKVIDTTGEHLVMHCHPGVLVSLCYESLNKILDFELNNNDGERITWYIHSNNYVQGRIGKMKSHLFIHQVIMNCFGNGKGTNIISVDHIDRDKLNNRFNNLRLATLKEQQQNTSGIMPGTLRQRSSKLELPAGLTYEMLKKYVYYNKENYGTSGVREFFRVEHPKLDKPWSGTKSIKVSVIEKLHEANKVAQDLDNDIYPVKVNKKIIVVENTITSLNDTSTLLENCNDEEDNVSTISSDTSSTSNKEIELPKYVRLINDRNKPHLIYDKKNKESRANVRMVLPANYNLQTELERLNTKVITKYGSEYGFINIK